MPEDYKPKYPPTDQDLAKVQHNFTYHPPKDDQAKRYEMLRDIARDLAVAYLENVPDSRERSVALTNLEQSVMWANAGIARNE